MEVHAAEPLVPEASPLEVKIAAEKLKRYKSVGVVKILAELMQVGGESLGSEIHKLIHSVWDKKELPH
jgi:hypothetical protein